ncbi:UxaA family hydrolase [Demequina lignilytica]|uniref:Altronate dehydratase family protein n=1 Tax=Demequina lignilytica TaxID=3051663 RepID=A0AB35MEV0_9MICO|nr:altronate dehydratase family protein [Demequina sp. SYSU T0a273]MDN4482268.1 altronate dehydratase family protein [Demequina sp. SYSU T0a273]
MATVSPSPTPTCEDGASAPADLTDVAIVLAPEDDVAVATRDLAGGTVLRSGGATLTVRTTVARGHKLAVRDLEAGATVRKYGQVIGRATADIAAGAHVHAHNLGMDDGARDLQVGVDRRDTVPAPERLTFQGYRRSDGSWGTRNYIGIVTSVNCSASTARMIADQFRGPVLDAYPHVDGVVALTHDTGCGLVPTSEGAQITLRTLRGYATHPNMAGLLVLGLGCEMLPAQGLLDGTGVREDVPVRTLIIQENGGIRATVRAGVAAIEEMLPVVDALRREEAPASALVLGLNCGGSDGYSGITANPALGHASDLLVAQGGTSILAETPEVYGAEHLLLRRAVSQDVADRLVDRLRWWERYAEAGGGTLDNNPSPGNKAGGLTTILEKSLGAIAKSGSSELVAVHEYAEKVAEKGLTFMDTPGYDPVSVTGIVAGGATVVVFTTGRGSVLGCKPSPSIKVATNTPMYERMSEDMDLNAGRIVDGTATVEQVGEEILARILAVASGEATVSEELDLGTDEFVPWQLGAVT